MDAWRWLTSSSVTMSEKHRVSGARHEASHAVAAAVLMGTDSLYGIKVNARSYPSSMPTGGGTFVDANALPYSLDAVLRDVAVNYAGGTAERAFDSQDYDSDASDIAKSKEAIAAYHADDREEDLQVRMLAQELRAALCAHAIVDANLLLIAALGDKLLAETPHFGRHALDPDQVRAFLTAHPPSPMPKSCTFTDMP
jgi:hypothetical protein